jgi:hypothetical protein
MRGSDLTGRPTDAFWRLIVPHAATSPGIAQRNQPDLRRVGGIFSGSVAGREDADVLTAVAATPAWSQAGMPFRIAFISETSADWLEMID